MAPVVDSAREKVASGFRRIVSGDPSGAPEWVQQSEGRGGRGLLRPGLRGVGRSRRTADDRGRRPCPAHAGAAPRGPRRGDAALALRVGRARPAGRHDAVAHRRDVRRPGGRRPRMRPRARHAPTGRRHLRHPDGPAPYAASDPDLLRWVHIAFTDSFLATHRVWGGEIPGGEDAYVREWAKAGELVGVVDPPRSVRDLEEQIDGYRGVLRGDAPAPADRRLHPQRARAAGRQARLQRAVRRRRVDDAGRPPRRCSDCRPCRCASPGRWSAPCSAACRHGVGPGVAVAARPRARVADGAAGHARVRRDLTPPPLAG